jgi:GT2 family glycosyltransferase
MMLPFVITVILNTNRCNDTLECLASLKESSYKNHKVIVLDNHSTDGSQQAIRELFPDVQLIELEENRGYAGNNNFGIDAAIQQGADWVFVLNEDTIIDPGCISNLVEVGESDPGVGIVGPMVYHHDEPDIIQSAGGMLGQKWESIHLGKNEPDLGQYSEPHTVEWISGCAILVRRAAIEQIGMLDPKFFYYWEETEWCLRAGEAGWRIVNVPQGKIWHKGVQRDYFPGPNVTYYATRNWFLLLSLHKAPLSVWVYVFWLTFRSLFSWTFNSQYIQMREHRKAMWQGLTDFFRHRWGMRPA